MLVEQTFGVVHSFAEPLREAIIEIVYPFFEGGRDEVRQWFMDSRKDNAVIPALGVTLRFLLQTLGTKWGRDIVHQEIWVRHTMFKATRSLRSYTTIIDDVRFPNEYDAIRKMGGLLFMIQRPDAPAADTSIGEGLLNDHEFDGVIENSGGLQDLQGAVGALVREHLTHTPDVMDYS